jgi:hypothetical protein
VARSSLFFAASTEIAAAASYNGLGISFMVMRRLAAGCAASVGVLVCSSISFAQTTVALPDPAPVPARLIQPAAPAITTTPERAGVGRSTLGDDLFKPLLGDFKRLGSHDNFLLIGVGASAAMTSHSWDRRVAISGWGANLEEQMEPGQVVGGFLLQAGGALATYTIGRTTNHPRLAEVGAHLFRAQIVAQGATQVIKFASQRTRPDGRWLSLTY